MTLYTSTTAMLMGPKTPPPEKPPVRVVRKPTREESDKEWRASR